MHCRCLSFPSQGSLQTVKDDDEELWVNDDDLSDIEHLDPDSFLSHPPTHVCKDASCTIGTDGSGGSGESDAGAEEHSYADSTRKLPGWAEGQLIGLAKDENGSILNAAEQGKMETLYPHVPVFGTWPSTTGSYKDLHGLGVDPTHFGVELERCVIGPRYFIRWELSNAS